MKISCLCSKLEAVSPYPTGTSPNRTLIKSFEIKSQIMIYYLSPSTTTEEPKLSIQTQINNIRREEEIALTDDSARPYTITIGKSRYN